ncbi:MAG TPA: HAMP domain-containing methyl-accepting chemotaxis protein [Bacteroidota bacterium]|nr:HAMP domain-containing methyl-accepting chemotaxis protein [Bacteroidota bacterium]
MKWFNNLKLSTKLIVGFIILATITAILGVISAGNFGSVVTADGKMFIDAKGLQHISTLKAKFLENRLSILSLATTSSEEGRQQQNEKIQKGLEVIKTEEGEFEKTLSTDVGKKMFADYKEKMNAYEVIRERAVAFGLAGKENELIGIVRNEGQQATTEVTNAIDALVDRKISNIEQNAKNNEQLASSGNTMILVGTILGALLALGLGIFLARAITNPVKDLAAQAETIAAGDLTVSIHYTSKDEIGMLADAFRKMVSGLRDTMMKVMEASSAVASASSEISSSTEQMAAGSQEQTSQAGEVASAVEEMTKTIIENSKNASNTASTAKRAKEAAEQGGKVVEETVVGMKRISTVVNKSADTVRALGKSSDQIGEIIGVIDDIADQTNLLALNAAIEAARAGEQGRGFAVVADEVRKLAERTTKATKEIAGMIKAIQADTAGAVSSMQEGTKEVESGIQLADRAGTSLTEIVGMIQELTDMVNQIAAASEEQSSASEQISKNVEAISTVTGETASGTQQIARASEDLNRLTENLQQLIEKFRLSDSERTTTRQHVSAVRRETSKITMRSNNAFIHHEA